MQIMAIDYCNVTNKGKMISYPAVPAVPDDPSTPEDETYAGIDAYDAYVNHAMCDDYGLATINKQFIAAGVIHFVSAVMYLFAWYPWMIENWDKTTHLYKLAILSPEFFNIIEACIYIRTAVLYAPYSVACLDYRCPEYVELHKMELAATAVNFVAAVLWVWQWYVTYVRGPGRGITPFDPDFWAQILLVVPSAMYIAYNLQVTNDLNSYETNKLYTKADVIYFVGAVLYLVGSMRDCDFFFFLKAVPVCVLPTDGESDIAKEVITSVNAISVTEKSEEAKSADSTLVIRNVAVAE